MFSDMKKHLSENGRVYLVALRGLKEFLKRNLKEYFGDCQRVAFEKEYVLFKVDLGNKD
jgi:16S rRNA G1207 methylase RsmC